MPREQVNYPDQYHNRDAKFNGTYRASELDPIPEQKAGSDLPTGTGPYLETTTHVSWHPEGGWVQLNLEVDRDSLRERIRQYDEAVAGGQVAPDETIMLPSAVLSPSEIDILIHYLRRAKRKAYRS